MLVKNEPDFPCVTTPRLGIVCGHSLSVHQQADSDPTRFYCTKCQCEEYKPMLVRCGRCGTMLDYSVTLCPDCGAQLIQINGSWYWKKAPKTGITKHFEEDENGKREDEWGNIE